MRAGTLLAVCYFLSLDQHWWGIVCECVKGVECFVLVYLYFCPQGNRVVLTRPFSHLLCVVPCVLRPVQKVRLVGNVKRHASEASVIASKDFFHYNVTKINTSGVRQKRILAVDSDDNYLWNFNTAMRLRKQLPIKQLVQVCQLLSLCWRSWCVCFLSELFGVSRVDYEQLWCLRAWCMRGP